MSPATEPRSVEVLATEAALGRAEERLGLGPAVDWLRMGDDGRLWRGDDEVPRAGASPEVAWGTADLFDGGPLRPFFGLVRRSTSLRWFASPAAGVDDPFFASLLDRGVRLTTSHVSAVPIAEYVVRAVLDVFQGAERWRRAQAERVWRPHARHREVWGSRWAVVGLGSIGTAVALRARALGAVVVGVRRSPRGDEPVDEVVTPDRLRAVAADVDVVVLATPATASTHHLVGADVLAAMRPGSVLVNVARGDVVDEAALLAALDRGVPEAAVLDVVGTEPLPPDSVLWAHPRITLTPHSSGRGLGRLDRAVEEFAENLRRYLRGAPLHHEVTAADLA